ncbi:Holliday junction resolvase RuvX [Thermanaerosceptrum fracticalcis]|uniref:Putative pre-16S rRNA nuclease n=1 Tax=Thermanaerosceptrum fracticalcis TaxID=1712410 RepID=A0A7G6DZR2_THEFR|nr:Holliday junction resolvase RuvX [Thermanaerosceptrum fracticalcis]QNB45316.1 Holliday junction resolvase RuvX [Thermanaerosceptrum fracticalcis]
MQRVLGLDIGDRRIGVSISDALGITAQGLDTIERSEPEKDIQSIVDIIKKWEIGKIVVGLPKNMNGTLGPQAEKVKEFIERLQQKVAIEVVFWDERLTTVAAERTLLEGNVSRKKRKGVIDKVAANMILQSYLDSCGHVK